MVSPQPAKKAAIRPRFRAPLYLSAIVLAVVAAGLLSPFRSGGRDVSDLAVHFTEVPGTLHAGKSVLVRFEVESLGSFTPAAFEARLWLVSYGVVGVEPALMATVRASEYGDFQIAASVPAEPGNGPWKLRVEVEPALTEESLENNVDVSSDVLILTFDLDLVDPSPIAFHPISDGDVLETQVEVINQGSAGGVLVFTAEVLGAPPWLSVDPASSFVLGGGAPVGLTLRCDPSLLPSSEASAVLRVASFDLPNDAVEVPVTVSLDPPTVSAGWTIVGSLGPGTDVDEVRMEGVKGLRVHLDLKVTAGTWSPRVRFMSPEGDLEETLNYKKTSAKASGKLVRRSHRLLTSGTYRLLVSDHAEVGGSYKVKVRRKLPKKARKRKLKLSASTNASVEIRAFAGATLNLHLDPNQAFEGPVQIGVTTPSGANYDVQAFVVPEGDSLFIKGLPIEQTGSYFVAVAGFGPSSLAKVQVVAHPKNPPKELVKLILP